MGRCDLGHYRVKRAATRRPFTVLLLSINTHLHTPFQHSLHKQKMN